MTDQDTDKDTMTEKRSRENSRSRPTTPVCIEWDPEIPDEEKDVHSTVQFNNRKIIWTPGDTTGQTGVYERLKVANMIRIKEQQQKQRDESFLTYFQLGILGLELEKLNPPGPNKRYEVLQQVEEDLANAKKNKENLIDVYMKAVDVLVHTVTVEKYNGKLLKDERTQLKEVEKTSYKKKLKDIQWTYNREDMANHFARLADLTTRLEDCENVIMIDREKEIMKAEMDLEAKMKEFDERKLETERKMNGLDNMKGLTNIELEQLHMDITSKRDKAIENGHLVKRAQAELEKIKNRGGKVDVKMERNFAQKYQELEAEAREHNDTVNLIVTTLVRRANTIKNVDIIEQKMDKEHHKECQLKEIEQEIADEKCKMKENEEIMTLKEEKQKDYECKEYENTKIDQMPWLQVTPTTTTTTTTTVTCFTRPISSTCQPDYITPERKSITTCINSDGPTTVAEALRRHDKVMKDWPKFDSNKLTDFVTWQTKIKQIRRLTCDTWDEDVLVKCLSIKTLNGNASQFFTEQDERKRNGGCPKWTLEEFFEHVLETNCAHSTPDVARRHFEEDKMTAEELEKGLFRQYSTRLQLKIKIAYRQEKKKDNDMLDRMVKDKFKRSLPQNIREHVERHTSFATDLNTIIGLAEKEFQINAQRKTETINNINTDKEENAETEDVAAVLGGSQRSYNNTQRGGYRGTNGRGRGGQRRINGNCFNCNGFGHRREDCFKPKKENGWNTRNGNNSYGNYRETGRQNQQDDDNKFERMTIYQCKICKSKSTEKKCINCELNTMRKDE